MDIGWAEIDKALDELVVHKEGVRFQRLARSLAQQRWPELIATEVYKDGGEDALAYSCLTEGGKQFDLAVSITADYQKIREDAERIAGRGIHLDFLIFYTAAKVSNEPTVQNWRKQFQVDFGWDLVVVSREEIIGQLIKPDNKWICAKLLRLQVESTPDVDDVIAKSADAAGKMVEKWQRLARCDAGCLIDLEAAIVDENNKPTGQLLRPSAIATHLTESARIVLKGSPGAGKTTTLGQVAEALLNAHQYVPILVSLPDWIESGEDVLTFVSKEPDFLAMGISSAELALLHKHGRLVFLLNGWNEIQGSLFAQGGRQLCRVDREFSAAGLIVASRENYIAPPLLGKLEIVLQPLDNTQRRTYIAATASEGSDELVSMIESSQTLDAVTRTPLFLSEIVRLHESGAEIPKTKYGILEAVTIHAEQVPEHSVSLQTEPISGRAREYLSALAFALTTSGRIAMPYEHALKPVNEVNEQLRAAGQITKTLDPRAIVDTLCGHHMLEKSVYPANLVHFTHQQFQEFYAATELRSQLTGLCTNEDQHAIKAFQRDIINIPVWEESLRLLAEKISGLISAREKMMPSAVDPLLAGRNLVEWTVHLDPVFATELVRILGEHMWGQVKGTLEAILREWYECTSPEHKECALAAMLATGSNDFSDIIWPLLESPDQQVRLSTYRVPRGHFLSCLGPKWKERVCGWGEDRRAELINELGLSGQLEIFDVFEDFARNDSSSKVRVTAVNAIGWCGRRDRLWEILKDCDDETFKMVVQHEFLLRKIPNNLLPRVIAAYDQLLSETTDQNERIRILLRRCDFAKSVTTSMLKTELDKYVVEGKSGSGTSLPQDAIAIIASEDPEWASNWVVQKQAEGKLYQEHWSTFIGTVPSKVIDEVIQGLLQKDCPQNHIYKVQGLITRGANREHARTILKALIEKHQNIVNANGPIPEVARTKYWRLRDAANAISWEVLASVIVDDYGESCNASPLGVILDLVGCGALERNRDVLTITEETLHRLRMILHSYFGQVLGEDDHSGRLKVELACALALFGNAEDIALIRKLVDADIERVRQGRRLLKQGNRADPRAQSASMCWSNWYIRAICRLDPEDADQQLIELLSEPEYERDAARGLVQLLKRDIPKEEFPRGLGPLKIGSAIEERDYIDEQKGKQYSAAIVERIKVLLDERKKAEEPDHLDYRLIELACILASIGECNNILLVLEVLQLPCEYHAWTRVTGLENLIKNGAEIETDAVESVLDQAMNKLAKEGISNDQDTFLLARCLSVLACTSDKGKAIARIKELTSKHRLHYEMRGVVAALGQTNSSEAAKYLIELTQNPTMCHMLAPELFEALAHLDVSESKNAILSIVDPKVPGPKLQLPPKDSVTYIVSIAIADWCRKDQKLESRIFKLCGEKLTAPQREIVAAIVNLLSTADAVYAGLSLIADDSKPTVPFYLTEAIKKTASEHVPSQDFAGSYHIRPRESTMIRSRLFDMACDDQARSRTAFDLLGLICQMRLEYGRPPMEPRHPKINRNEPWPPLGICKLEK